MRAVVNVKDILAAANKSCSCPICSAPALVVQNTVQISKKGEAVVVKTALCEEHGPITFEEVVKTVLLHGQNAQVIPHYE